MVEMAEECLRIDIPYPVRIQAMSPYPVQGAVDAAGFVEVLQVPAGCWRDIVAEKGSQVALAQQVVAVVALVLLAGLDRIAMQSMAFVVLVAPEAAVVTLRFPMFCSKY